MKFAQVFFCFSFSVAALSVATAYALPEVPAVSTNSTSYLTTPESLIASGSTSFHEGNLQAAATAFAEAASFHDDSEPFARLLQAKTLAALARFNDVVVVLDRFLEISPRSPDSFDALILRGQALVAASSSTPHFHEAALSFSQALEIDGISASDSALAAFYLTDALLRIGEYHRAEHTITHLAPATRTNVNEIASAFHNFRVSHLLDSLYP